MIYYFILYIIDSALFRSSDRTVGGPGTRLEPGTSGLEAETLTSDNYNVGIAKKNSFICIHLNEFIVHNQTVTAVHM